MTTPSAPWAYTTPRENAAILTAALLSTTAFTAGLAAVFSPWALAVAAGYVAYPTALLLANGLSPAFNQTFHRKLARSHHITNLTTTAPQATAVLLTGIISRKLGIAPPPVLLFDDKIMRKSTPLFLRWLWRNPQFRHRAMRSVFAAEPHTNMILATHESLARLDTDKMSFVMAHEMGHIRADKFSPATLARLVSGAGTTALLVITGASVAAGLAGIALPVLTGTSVLGALGVLAVSKIGAGIINNIGMRIAERRADRNALYMTGDFDSAKEALELLHGTLTEDAERTSLFDEAFNSHPGLVRRVETLRASFALVSSRSDFIPVVRADVAAPANDNADGDAWSIPPEKTGTVAWTTPETLRRKKH